MSNKINYLVIDDTDKRDLLETAISETELGYDCIIAKTIERAKERLSSEPDFQPGYIFMDWNLELLNFIKAIPHLANSQVIVYGDLHAEAINEAKAAGASHCLLKTTHETAMTKVLHHLFEDKQAPFVLVFPVDERSGYLR